jgi:hypothetical protein
MNQELSTYPSLGEGRGSAPRIHPDDNVGPLRRTIGFVLGVAFTTGGGWLLYRNLVYGDIVSVTIALLSALMIGIGVLILPTAVFGRRDW